MAETRQAPTDPKIALDIKLLLFIHHCPVSIDPFRRQEFRVPVALPLKTKDGRFAYEAAGDPAMPPLVFLHGIGGAARAWRGQAGGFGDRTVRSPGTCRAMAARRRSRPSASPPWPTPCRNFLQADRRGEADPGRAFDRRHDRAAMADPASRMWRARWCWRRPARPSARPTAIGRNHSSRRGSARSIAAKPWSRWRQPGQGTGRRRSRLHGHGACARMHGERSRGELSRHDAGAAGLRPAQCAQGHPVPTLVLSGSKDNNAPAPMMAKMATTFLQRLCRARRRPAISPIWSNPSAFNAALDQFLKADPAATR